MRRGPGRDTGTVARLRAVLSRMRAALREGRYGDLPGLVADQTVLLAALERSAPADRAALQGLLADAVRTARLAGAAREGMRAGLLRRRELAEAGSGGSTYDADGQRMRLKRGGSTFELRR